MKDNMPKFCPDCGEPIDEDYAEEYNHLIDLVEEVAVRVSEFDLDAAAEMMAFAAGRLASIYELDSVAIRNTLDSGLNFKVEAKEVN